MSRKPVGLLSFGVFVIIVAISLVVYALNVIPNLSSFMALIIALYGCWTVALAGIRVKNPEKYVRSAFSTFVWGVLLAALGGAWFIASIGVDLLYSALLLLVVVGILAVVSALRGFKK